MSLKKATYVKMHFGECINEVNKEPLIIESYGKKSAVMISYDAYPQLQAYKDYYWGEKSQKALKQSKFLSPEESLRYIQSKLNIKSSIIKR